VVALQDLRDVIREPIYVLSGSRCIEHNARVGGTRRSFHLRQRLLDRYTCAADIMVQHLPLIQLFDQAEYLPAFAHGGIGVYVDATPRLHLDVRGVTREYGPSRWAHVDGKPSDIEHALEIDLARRKARR
jgi:uncharacterized protein YcbK (DUF882 family)